MVKNYQKLAEQKRRGIIRSIDFFKEDIKENTSKQVNKWFDEIEDLDIDDSNAFINHLKITHYVKRNRVGISGELSNGKPVNFAFPYEMLEIKVIKSVVGNLVSKYPVEKSNEFKTPRIISTNTQLIKQLETLGFSIIVPLIDSLRKNLKPDQMSILMNYFYSKILQIKGLERLNLTLKTNTPYFREKASKLAGLRNGVGTWSLVAIDYHGVSDNGFGFCTLGHKLKWEFIVQEETSKETISFGAYCVSDFFQVDNDIYKKLGVYKNLIINYLLDYALQLSSAYQYAYNIDRWVSAYTMPYVRYSKKFESTHNTLLEFIKSRVLVPQLLMEEVIQNFPIGDYKNAFFELSGLLGGEFLSLATLGVFGNSLLSTDGGMYLYEFGEKHTPATMNLYNNLVYKDDTIRLNLKSLGIFYSKKDLTMNLSSSVSKLRSIRTYKEYVNLSNHLTNLLASLKELKEVHDFKVETMYGKVVSFKYKGVYVLVPNWTFSQFYKNFTSKDFELYNVSEKSDKLSLQFSKITDESVKNSLMEIRDLFKIKNTINNRLEIRPLRKVYDDEELTALVKLALTKTATLHFLSSYYIGCLKEEVLKEFIKKKLGVEGVYSPKPKVYDNTLVEEGLIPWGIGKSSKETISLMVKNYRILAEFNAKEFRFPYEVLRTIRDKGFISNKQKAIIDKSRLAVEQLVVRGHTVTLKLDLDFFKVLGISLE